MDFSRFRCRRCGACCKWEGPVRVSEEEIRKIAGFLNMDVREFINTRTVLTSDRRGLSLMEKPDGICFYYDDTAKCCRINPVKPRQCSDFPAKWNFPGWETLCEGGRKWLQEEAGKKT